MPKKTEPLAELLAKEVVENLRYFSSLWDGYDAPGNLEAPHRQRTTVNKLRGYAQFLRLGEGRKGDGFEALGRMRRWQKRIGPMRDLDVTAQWLEKCRLASGTRGRAAARALQGELHERREALRTEIAADAKGFTGSQVRLAVHEVNLRFGQAIEQLADERRPFDAAAALQAVVLPWQKGLNQLHRNHGDVTLHAFRVHNKRLRFVLELLATQGYASAKGAASTCQTVHTALGNLSDMLVLRDTLRMARAQWMAAGRRMETSAGAIEQARLAIETEQFTTWFAQWPVITAPDFLDRVMKEIA